MTTVVNFRDVKQHWNPDTRTWDDPQFVYIGRANRHYRLPGSVWANPYPMQSEANRETVIQLFRERALSLGLTPKNVEVLRGKTLVCWCAPKACHGHVLLEILGEREAAPETAETEDDA